MVEKPSQDTVPFQVKEERNTYKRKEKDEDGYGTTKKGKKKGKMKVRWSVSREKTVLKMKIDGKGQV